MADETELFYTPVSKVVVFATLLVSVSDLHKGLSSFVFPVKQITQNPVVATPYRFDPGHRHQLLKARKPLIQLGLRAFCVYLLITLTQMKAVTSQFSTVFLEECPTLAADHFKISP